MMMMVIDDDDVCCLCSLMKNSFIPSNDMLTYPIRSSCQTQDVLTHPDLSK